MITELTNLIDRPWLGQIIKGGYVLGLFLQNEAT